MISKETAVAAHHRQEFYHARLRNRDGTAVRCRANGACKVWKTRPDDFRLPVKYGLRECFYLTPQNAADWLTEDPTALVPERGYRRPDGTVTQIAISD